MMSCCEQTHLEGQSRWYELRIVEKHEDTHGKESGQTPKLKCPILYIIKDFDFDFGRRRRWRSLRGESSLPSLTGSLTLLLCPWAWHEPSLYLCLCQFSEWNSRKVGTHRILRPNYQLLYHMVLKQIVVLSKLNSLQQTDLKSRGLWLTYGSFLFAML